MEKFLMYFVLASVFIFVATWVGVHFFGTDLWKKCTKCGSRRTRTTKGWTLTTAMADNGFIFERDTECDCCHHREKIVLPRNEWPTVPSI